MLHRWVHHSKRSWHTVMGNSTATVERYWAWWWTKICMSIELADGRIFNAKLKFKYIGSGILNSFSYLSDKLPKTTAPNKKPNMLIDLAKAYFQAPSSQTIWYWNGEKYSGFPFRNWSVASREGCNSIQTSLWPIVHFFALSQYVTVFFKNFSTLDILKFLK